MSRTLVTIALLSLLLVLVGCGGKRYHESLQMPNFNYGELLDGQMERAQKALAGVRDMPSAEAAARRLGEVNQDLDDLVYNAPRLSPEGQIELGKLATGHLATVQQLAQEMNSNPVLEEVFGAELKTMIGHLQALATGRGE
jgi:hypothetical protein